MASDAYKKLDKTQRLAALVLWDESGKDAPPSGSRDWDLIEFGRWLESVKAQPAYSPHVDRERVLLLLARRKRDTGQSISDGILDLNEYIRHVAGPKRGELIAEGTIRRWAIRRDGPETAQGVLDNDHEIKIIPEFSDIDHRIRLWESLNGTPINADLPEGW
jgi:hypothetical protein